MAKVQIKSEKLTLLEAFFQSWSNLTQFLETEKYDAKPTYKKFLGYRPGIYVIGDFGDEFILCGLNLRIASSRIVG